MVKKKENRSEKERRIPTMIMRESIGHCETREEFERLVREHDSQYISWEEYIRPQLARKLLTDARLAAGCGKKVGTVTNFKKKIPTKREYVIMMAMMLGKDQEQTNTMLSRWAKYPVLYAKNPQDALWIYLLEKGGSQVPERLFREYWAVYEEEAAAYQQKIKGRRTGTVTTQIVTREVKDYAKRSVTFVAQEDQVYREMLRQHMPLYATAYDKLMQCLENHMEILSSTEGSAHKLFSQNPYFHEVYYKKMGELRKERKLPSREFLIAMGIHMNLNPYELDDLLGLAGMGPMCAKDRLEAALVFYLEELNCECPSVFYNWNTLYGQTDYYKLHDDNGAAGRIKLGPQDEQDLRLSEYIKRRMEEIGIFEEDEKKRVEEFLKML